MSSRRIVLAAAEGEYEMDIVRTLFREYADWLQVDLCFQDFESELAGLPGKFAPPRGGLWLARVDGKVAGTVAFRPFTERECEMKRLWVRPDFRGIGLGRRLAETCLAAACQAKYSAIYLDTLERMPEARALYEALGFREVPAYYHNPLPDVHFLKCELAMATE